MTHDPSRILDANANRAREALRVMEDAARFLLNDADLCAQLKALRHDLRAALEPHAHRLNAARDTPGDVGASISTPAEHQRTGVRGVVVAAGKRLSEALRSIEEYAKTIDTVTAPAVEALRYRAYELERRLTAAMPTGRAPQWSLCVLITESLCAHHPWYEVARRALDAGADCLQLREKDLEGGELYARAERLLKLASATRAGVIVNDRLDVALAAGAHAVHLGQSDLPLERARALAGGRLLIGVSTHSIDQAAHARARGADYLGVGPMFASTTKRRATIAGPAALRAYLAHDPPLPPHLAIGGITPENIGELADDGVRGVAVSACVCAARDPAAICKQLIDAIESRRS